MHGVALPGDGPQRVTAALGGGADPLPCGAALAARVDAMRAPSTA